MIKGKSAAVIFLALVMVLASAATAFGAQVIGEKKALSIAKANAGAVSSAKNVICEYEGDDSVYEIHFKKGSRKYSYEIDALSGRILEKNIDWKYKASSAARIGKNAAKKKALSFTGLKESQVKDLRCYHDYDDGKDLYVVKFTRGNYSYECEINARSGSMVEYSRDFRLVY